MEKEKEEILTVFVHSFKPDLVGLDAIKEITDHLFGLVQIGKKHDLKIVVMAHTKDAERFIEMFEEKGVL